MSRESDESDKLDPLVAALLRNLQRIVRVTSTRKAERSMKKGHMPKL